MLQPSFRHLNLKLNRSFSRHVRTFSLLDPLSRFCTICSLLWFVHFWWLFIVLVNSYNPTPSKHIHHCWLFCPIIIFTAKSEPGNLWECVLLWLRHTTESVWACLYCLLSGLCFFYGQRGAFGPKSQPSLGDCQISDDSHVNADHLYLSMPTSVPANWASPSSRSWQIGFISTDAEWKLLKQIDPCQQIQRHNKLGGFVFWAAWDRTSFTGIRGCSCLALAVVQTNLIQGSGLFTQTSPWQSRGLGTLWEEPPTSR